MNEIDIRNLTILKDTLATLYSGPVCQDLDLAALIREKIKLIVEKVI